MGFRVYASAPQIVPNTTYTKLEYNTKIYDTNNEYDPVLYRWTPKITVPTEVFWMGQTWIVGGAAQSGNSQGDVKVLKNGLDTITGISMPNLAFPGIEPIQFTGMDLAQPGDYYEAWLWVNASSVPITFPSSGGLGTVQIDTNPAHVWWAGRY